jgi:hypothetical protein
VTAAVLIYGEPVPGLARAAIDLAVGQVLQAGTVLGQIRLGAVTVQPGANSGNGTLTLDPEAPICGRIDSGTYRCECIGASPTGGTFIVYAPGHRDHGTVLVGANYRHGIAFSIAAGSIDFAVGDSFTIAVAKGSRLFRQLDPSALDGSQVACAILLDDVDASLEAQRCVGIVGNVGAVINAGALIWPNGYTEPQKVSALQDMRMHGHRFN